MFNNEEEHGRLRRKVVKHMSTFRDRFQAFTTTSFDSYLSNMSQDGIWGDDLEIRALEEICDRPIEIYSTESEEDDLRVKTHFDEEKVYFYFLEFKQNLSSSFLIIFTEI